MQSKPHFAAREQLFGASSPLRITLSLCNFEAFLACEKPL
jgi:hypothetical protein